MTALFYLCIARYNLGVAYDRMNEVTLSEEYYRRAAKLGHSLA